MTERKRRLGSRVVVSIHSQMHGKSLPPAGMTIPNRAVRFVGGAGPCDRRALSPLVGESKPILPNDNTLKTDNGRCTAFCRCESAKALWIHCFILSPATELPVYSFSVEGDCGIE